MSRAAYRVSQETPTGARGEAILQAGDREVRALYTNRALADAEQVLGRSAVAVAQGFSDGSSGMRELSVLLRVGMEAARRDAHEGGRAITPGDTFEVLDQVGYTRALAAVLEGVAAVLGYSGDEASEDPNP